VFAAVVFSLNPPQKLKLTDWMLVMCKLSEVQMNSKLDAVADEVDPQKEQLQKLVDEKKQQQETIEQQKSVISGINALLKESAK
jgi:ribosomal silencing factor RsfS